MPDTSQQNKTRRYTARSRRTVGIASWQLRDRKANDVPGPGSFENNIDSLSNVAVRVDGDVCTSPCRARVAAGGFEANGIWRDLL